VQPELNVFGLTLQTFGLMLGIAFIVCGWMTARYLEEIGKPRDWAYEFIFAAIIGGLVGSRLWWVVENWDETSDDLFGSLFTGKAAFRLQPSPRVTLRAAVSTGFRAPGLGQINFSKVVTNVQFHRNFGE